MGSDPGEADLTRPRARALRGRRPGRRPFGAPQGAERVSPSRWALTANWQAHLRELGERGDIIKQIHKAMRGGAPERFHAIRHGQGLPDGRGGVDERAVVGPVASKGLEDELKGVWYAVIETPTGAAYHVRLNAP